MARRALPFNPHSLAAKLYGILIVAVISIVALGYAGSHMASVTADAAINLSRDGVDGIVKATELEVLIEKHRRIVESTPAEVDRDEIGKNRRALSEIEVSLRRLCEQKTDEAARTAAARLPALTAVAQEVMDLANSFAIDSAQDAVNRYLVTAEEIQAAIREIKSRRRIDAAHLVDRLLANAQRLTAWGTTAGTIALAVLAPFGLLVLGDGARRLRALWRAMHRIARNDIGHPVPSLQDIDEIGDMARAVQVFKDNAVVLAEQRGEIEQINRFLDIALNNMARGLSMFDANHRLVLCNESYRALYDLSPTLVARGTPWSAIAAHRDTQIERIETAAGDAAITLETMRVDAATRTSMQAHQVLKDGRIIAIAAQPLEDGGWVAVHEDVTQQRQAEARMVRLARRDTLTDLANRHVFREEIEARCTATTTSSFALLLIDLDRFKQVNDTLGHPIGDALLEAVAARLRAITRAGDIVARIGGDEFAILQDGASHIDASESLAARLIDAISEPYRIQGHRIVIGASVGIARFPADGISASALFGNADLALYASKDNGRGTATLFDARMKEAALAERALEADLKAALEGDQFELHYQPILDLESGRTVSCEALLRWRHPARGLVPPLDFIPFAEQTGLIVPIGRWVLRRACLDAARWPGRVRVAVNLSPAQVLAGDLPAEIQGLLEETGLANDRLELEVTETLLLSDEPATRNALIAIRALGVHVSLDDFGTGYASLGYLRRFPFDKLKIDQMFVRDITDEKASIAIVRAVASLAKSLEMVAVAEGIETKAHLARVAAAGCTQVQGYLFSRPVPADRIVDVITTCRVPLLDDMAWIEAAQRTGT